MFRSDNLFSRFMNVLFDVICVGVLWVIASIPVVTSGAAFTAAYYTMSKSVRHKTGYVGREFLHSLKINLKQTLPLTILFLTGFVILGIDILYVWMNDSKLNSALFMILLLILFLISGLWFFGFTLLSRFDKCNMELIKMAAVLMFRYLPVTVFIMAVFIIAGIAVYLMPWTVLIIPGAYLYGLSFPMEWILKKIMPVPEEDSEEAMKWYYQ